MYKAMTFLILFVCWFLFSGQYDAVHLAMGAASAAFVTWLSGDLFFEDRSLGHKARVIELLKLIRYSLWLLWEITVANIQVFKIVMKSDIKEAVEPQIFSFETKLKTDFARFLLANSITLTPGTVTIKIEDDTFIVHAISAQFAEDCPGKMEEKLYEIFEMKSEVKSS